jgi:hypothetical protein
LVLLRTDRCVQRFHAPRRNGEDVPPDVRRRERCAGLPRRRFSGSA